MFGTEEWLAAAQFKITKSSLHRLAIVGPKKANIHEMPCMHIVNCSICSLAIGPADMYVHQTAN